MHSFIQQISAVYYLPGTVLGARITIKNKADCFLKEFTFYKVI